MKCDLPIGVKIVRVTKVKEGQAIELDDKVIVERPLEIRVQYRNRISQVAITMRTPGDDRHLALGFLFTEGIVTSIDEIDDVEIIEDNVIQVNLKKQSGVDPDRLQRNTYMSSSCGICGKASLDLINTHTQYLPWASKFTIAYTDINRLIRRVNEEESLFKITGGNHSVALFDIESNMVAIAEDVGRHNAMDKLIGNQFIQNQLPLHKHICFLSGRASFELIQKAMMAGIACVVSKGAPSSLAIDLAEECGMTLIGFVKSNGGNIYNDNNRICV